MITVDAREGFDHLSLGDKVERLDYGDYKIEAGGKTLIIERKTIPGFWNDIKSGRLNEQLVGCDALVIEQIRGHIEYFNDKDIFYDALNGVSRHHMVWWVISTRHLGETLRRYEKQMEDGTFSDWRRTPVKEDLPGVVRRLASFTGIGIERAKILLRAYGNLQNIYFAISDLDAQNLPEGIGQVIMNKIKDDFAEVYKE